MTDTAHVIITNIIGGLGNQMFQYACGRAPSRRLGCELRLHTRQFDTYKAHNGYELSRLFDLPCATASRRDLRCALGPLGNPAIIRFLIHRPHLRWVAGKRILWEPDDQAWVELDKAKPPLFLYGYWQRERYFKGYEAVLREDFRFKAPMEGKDLEVAALMRQRPSVSVHVRRGDHTLPKNQKVFAPCGPDYYGRALGHVKERFPSVRVFLFSDDPAWVREHLAEAMGDCVVVDHNQGANSSNDLRLMGMADHHIIATSTFSWWGAWLDPKPDKIVVAPKVWFAPGRFVNPDIVPEGWVRL